MNIPLALRHKSVRLSPREAARRASDPFSRHGTAGHPVSSGERFRQVSSDARHRDARARRAGDRRGSGKRDPFVRKPRFEIVARLKAIHGRAPVDVGRARIILIACAAAVLHPVPIFRLGIPACSARPRRAHTGHLTGSACDWKRSALSRRIREGFAPRSSNWVTPRAVGIAADQMRAAMRGTNGARPGAVLDIEAPCGGTPGRNGGTPASGSDRACLGLTRRRRRRACRPRPGTPPTWLACRLRPRPWTSRATRPRLRRLPPSPAPRRADPG